MNGTLVAGGSGKLFGGGRGMAILLSATAGAV